MASTVSNGNDRSEKCQRPFKMATTVYYGIVQKMNRRRISLIAFTAETGKFKMAIWFCISHLCQTFQTFLSIAVFVYSMPGYKCSIKDRMLYSTCKGPLLDVATDRVGMTIARKVGLKI